MSLKKNSNNGPDILPPELAGLTPTTKVIPMPADKNANDDIFGGWLMSQMDLASADRARERARRNVVTVHAETTFEQPINVGDLVSIYTAVQSVGNTSVTVKIDVWAQRRVSRIYEKVASGKYTFVAIDKDKNKVVIDPKP